MCIMSPCINSILLFIYKTNSFYVVMGLYGYRLQKS